MQKSSQSIRRYFVERGCDDPFDGESGRAFLRQVRAKARRTRHTEIYADDIYHRLIDSFPQTNAGVRNAAMAALVFGARLRGLDIAALDAEHVTFVEAGAVIQLVSNRRRSRVVLRRLVDPTYCAVALLERQLRRIDFRGPAFRNTRTQERLSKSGVTCILRKALKGVAGRGVVAGLKGAAIMLAASRGADDTDISAQLGVTPVTIEAWKHRARKRSASAVAQTLLEHPPTALRLGQAKT